MSSNELAEAMKTIADLVHRVYNETNEGPRLLRELMREYPPVRSLRKGYDAKEGFGELSRVPTTSSGRY